MMSVEELQTIVATLSEDDKRVLRQLLDSDGAGMQEHRKTFNHADPQHDAAADAANATFPLRGTVGEYRDPFEPAVPIEDWEALR